MSKDHLKRIAALEARRRPYVPTPDAGAVAAALVDMIRAFDADRAATKAGREFFRVPREPLPPESEWSAAMAAAMRSADRIAERFAAQEAEAKAAKRAAKLERRAKRRLETVQRAEPEVARAMMGCPSKVYRRASLWLAIVRLRAPTCAGLDLSHLTPIAAGRDRRIAGRASGGCARRSREEPMPYAGAVSC